MQRRDWKERKTLRRGIERLSKRENMLEQQPLTRNHPSKERLSEAVSTRRAESSTTREDAKEEEKKVKQWLVSDRRPSRSRRYISWYSRTGTSTVKAVALPRPEGRGLGGESKRTKCTTRSIDLCSWIAQHPPRRTDILYQVHQDLAGLVLVVDEVGDEAARKRTVKGGKGEHETRRCSIHRDVLSQVKARQERRFVRPQVNKNFRAEYPVDKAREGRDEGIERSSLRTNSRSVVFRSSPPATFLHEGTPTSCLPPGGELEAELVFLTSEVGGEATKGEGWKMIEVKTRKKRRMRGDLLSSSSDVFHPGYAHEAGLAFLQKQEDEPAIMPVERGEEARGAARLAR